MASDTERTKQAVSSLLNASDLADAIWAQAILDELGPGDRIGAERELAARYEVSRWLVRKALETLEERHLVLRTNGRNGGVFVAHEKVVRDLRGHVGLPEYVRARGLEAGATVLGTNTLPAEPELAAVMELAEGDWVVRIDRLRLAAAMPLSLETAWFPAELFPGLLDRSLVGSMYELLETQYGLERGEAVENISARPAERGQASALQVPAGTPILSVNRTARTATGQVFEYSEELFRADRVEMVVQVTSGESAVRRFVGVE